MELIVLKKWLISIALVFITILFSACGSSQSSEDNSWKKVEEKKELIVATSGTLFPSSYYSDDNKLIGYDVDVAKAVAKKLKMKITFKEYNVDGQVTAVDRGEADFAANDFGMSEERSKKFSLSSPIKHSFDSMIVRKNEDSGIHSLNDLKGKKAAGEPNTSYMKIAEKYGAKAVTYDNATNDQYLTDVANGRTDVILNDYYLQKMSIAALPNIPVKILEDVYFNANTTGFLFDKKNQALKSKINQALAELKSEGALKKISEQYFGTDVSVKPEQEVNEKVSAD